MTGSLGKLSMYTMQGHDEVIIRTKGGPTKRQIKTKPEFEKLRRNNSEWAGCTKMGSQIRESIYPMKRLEDYPITGTLNAICKHIQKQDTESETGKRSIRLSEHKNMINGLSFSRKQVLESVLRVPVTTSLDREAGVATIEIPAINTDLYLYNFRGLPSFRIVACLGGVCDMTYSEAEKRYARSEYLLVDKERGVYQGDWMPATGTQPGVTIQLNYPRNVMPIADDVTMLVCLGVEFGKNGYGNTTEPVKYAGTGKIVRVG